MASKSLTHALLTLALTFGSAEAPAGESQQDIVQTARGHPRGQGRYVPAGESQKALIQCLMNSATANDKETLAEWLFAAMSLYPRAAKLSPITSEVRKSVSQAAAKVMQRLISEECLKEAQAAAKSEGLPAVSGSMQIMGEIAGRELLTHPDVTAGMSAVGQFMDAKKIEAAVAPGAGSKPEDSDDKPPQ